MSSPATSVRLSDAVRANDPAATVRALDCGEALDQRDADGRTALHLAAAVNAVDAARVLLDRGADPNALDRFGMAPLFRAVFDDHGAMVDLLHEWGAQLLCRGAMSFPRLPVAAGWFDADTVNTVGFDLEDTVAM